SHRLWAHALYRRRAAKHDRAPCRHGQRVSETFLRIQKARRKCPQAAREAEVAPMGQERDHCAWLCVRRGQRTIEGSVYVRSQRLAASNQRLATARNDYMLNDYSLII